MADRVPCDRIGEAILVVTCCDRYQTERAAFRADCVSSHWEHWCRPHVLLSSHVFSLHGSSAHFWKHLPLRQPSQSRHNGSWLWLGLNSCKNKYILKKQADVKMLRWQWWRGSAMRGSTSKNETLRNIQLTRYNLQRKGMYEVPYSIHNRSIFFFNPDSIRAAWHHLIVQTSSDLQKTTCLESVSWFLASY